MALSVSHRPPPSAKPLDASLRGFLATNADIATRIPVGPNGRHWRALGPKRAPILFENIVEKPGFRLCDIW